MDNVTPMDVKNKMIQALAHVKEALDMSIPLLKTNQKHNIISLWEAFIKEFIQYTRRRSKETETNLIGSVSLRKIWFK